MDDRDGIDEDGQEYLDEHDTVEVIDLDELLGSWYPYIVLYFVLSYLWWKNAFIKVYNVKI